MFHTKQSDYNIAQTPFGRDLTGELADACHKAGLRFGVYYSQRDWHHPDYLQGDNKKYTDFMHAQIRELLIGYGRVDIMWFDSFGTSDLLKDWRVYELLGMVRRLQPGILVNNRLAILAQYNRGPRDLWGDFDTPEQRIGSFQHGRAWESCMTLTRNPGGWSYHVGAKPRELDDCLRAIVYCAGGDGNLTWGLGPMPSGEIAPAEAQRLREIGRWLDQYGESIYGTRGGPFKPGDWGASTRKSNAIYLHVLKWPGEVIVLPNIAHKIVKAVVLAGGTAEIGQTDSGIRVAVPPRQRQPIDTIVKLDLDGPAERPPARGLRFGKRPSHGRRHDSGRGKGQVIRVPRPHDWYLQWAARGNLGSCPCV